MEKITFTQYVYSVDEVWKIFRTGMKDIVQDTILNGRQQCEEWFLNLLTDALMTGSNRLVEDIWNNDNFLESCLIFRITDFKTVDDCSKEIIEYPFLLDEVAYAADEYLTGEGGDFNIMITGVDSLNNPTCSIISSDEFMKNY